MLIKSGVCIKSGVFIKSGVACQLSSMSPADLLKAKQLATAIGKSLDFFR